MAIGRFNMKSKRSKLVAAGAALLMTVGVGGAYAYWTATGSGTGSVTTGDYKALVIHQGPEALGMIVPGSEITVGGSIDNPNTTDVTIKGVTATIGTLPAACAASWFTITPSTTEVTIPGTAGAAWSGLKISMPVNAAVNQDGCKGLAIPLVFSVAP